MGSIIMGVWVSFMVCLGVAVFVKGLIRVFQWLGDELPSKDDDTRTEDEKEEDRYLDDLEYQEGYKKGYEDGVIDGLRSCRKPTETKVSKLSSKDNGKL